MLPSFLLPSNQAYVELRVGVKSHVCFAYVVKSKTRSKQKRVIQPDQEVLVCGIFFWWIVDELHWMIYLSLCIFFSWTWAIYIFFFFFFFDMSCGHVAYLLWVCIFSLFFILLSLLLGTWHTFLRYASFISFCIAHILDGNLGERESHDRTWSSIL